MILAEIFLEMCRKVIEKYLNRIEARFNPISGKNIVTILIFYFSFELHFPKLKMDNPVVT